MDEHGTANGSEPEKKPLSVEDILKEYSTEPTVPEEDEPLPEEEEEVIIYSGSSSEEDNVPPEEEAPPEAAGEDNTYDDIIPQDFSLDDPPVSEESSAEDGEEEYDGDEYDEEDDEDEYEEDEEERPRRKKHKKRSHNRLAVALVLVTLVITAAVFGAMFVIAVAKEILAIDRRSMEVSVEIPMNADTQVIGDILKAEGVIEHPMVFRVMSRLKRADGTYTAGVHKVNPNMTYGNLMQTLQEAAISPREFVTLTFPEGIRLIEAAEILEENGVCSKDDFIRAFNSSSFGFDFEKQIKASPKKFYKMEGVFFPDTYEFYLDEDPKNVAKKVYKNFERRFTPDYYARMEDMGMTLEETLTLASIVQREAGDTVNMKLVASVFHNRLNNLREFPKLQSDPTSNYVEEVIKPNMEVYSDTICKDYDTYKGSGLPPGPICNPGLDAIEAVLYPRETNYYFFCSSLDTEEFYYAENYEEHRANLIQAGLTEHR